MLEDVRAAYERAQNQRDRANRALSSFQNNFTGDDFKKLFILRAELAMIEHRTPGEFIIDSDNREILNMMYYYAVRIHTELINPSIGVILTGKFGCGKSIMMSAFCKVLNDLVIPDQKIEEIHSIALVEIIKNEGILPWAKKPLLIQDLGMEESSVNIYGTKINPIANLLAVRAEYGALTFGSANKRFLQLSLHLEDIKVETDAELRAYESIPTYIGTRLKEHVNFLHLNGNSRRKSFVSEKVK